MENKKAVLKLGIIIVLGLFLINFISAEPCDLNVELVNQDPYPAVPGAYVEVVFQVSGVENPECDGAWFEIYPSYPFSLDGENARKILDGSTYVSNYKTEWMIPYELRIDGDAIEESSEINVKYGQGSTIFSEYFNITIQDSRANFDAVVQEVTGSEVSIALANTGKYTANSIIVRVPNQENFKVIGMNGQMVGNLDSGDYTLVNFDIMSVAENGVNNFQIDIHYTDNLGERRIVNFKLPLRMVSSDLASGGVMVPGSKQGSSMQPDGGSNENNWAFWIVVIILLGVGFILYKKYSKQMLVVYNNLKSGSKKSLKSNSNVIPDWVKGEISKKGKS